jgi:hypothetical protein
MPAKSKAQQRLMAAAEHGASFPAAKKLRQSMTRDQLHDFAATTTKTLPAHAPKSQHESYAYDWRQRSGLKRGR